MNKWLISDALFFFRVILPLLRMGMEIKINLITFARLPNEVLP